MAIPSSSSSSTSAYYISSQIRFLSSPNSDSTFQNLPFSFIPKPVSHSSKVALPSGSKLSICSVAKTTPQQVELQFSTNSSLSVPISSWEEFASKVSGEWDGFEADFTNKGEAIELPESVVPEAYREWEVTVFDWQTQCPTLADPKSFHLSYRSIRLLPTVGCEADAATVYSSDERNVGVKGGNVLSFAYQNSGNYVALWPFNENGEAYKVLELEHCLIDPRDKESRVRVIQIIRVEGAKLTLQKIRVFCELWYGPFRNGDQLGGCAIRDSAFASTAALENSNVIGVWQSRVALANFHSSQDSKVQELIGQSTEKVVRNEEDLISLPRQLWCSLKESGDGETCGEVGWLLDPGFAISSRCIFSNDGKVKVIAVGHDTADLN